MLKLCCLEILGLYSCDDSMNNQNLRSSELLYQKIILIFPRILLNVSLLPIEKLGIINLSSYKSKSYISVVLSTSEVTFFLKGKDVPFRPYLYSVLFINRVAYSEKYVINYFADCFYIFSFQPNQRAAPVAHKVV